MRTYLILDIETVPDRELVWDAARDGFPPPLFHEVVALGVLWLQADYTFRRLGVFGAQGPVEKNDEAHVLKDFSNFVGRERPHIVTYNGRAFDLPVLVNRCLRHGVGFAAYYNDRDYRYRYSELGHVDLADLLTEHGASRKPRLDHLAQLIGLPGKLSIDGSMVQTLHEQARLDEIRTYCLQDVVQTAFLFLRCELLRGRLTRDEYCERALSLWKKLEEDPRVRPILESADPKRVLLEAQDSSQQSH